MAIDGLFSLLSKKSEYQSLIALFGQSQATGHTVLLDSALPYLVGALRDNLKTPMLVLVPKPERARKIYEDLVTWCGEESEIYQLPDGERLPFERLIGSDETTHDRIRALAALLRLDYQNPRPHPVIVASMAAISQRTLDFDLFQTSCHYVSVGQTVNMAMLMGWWQKIGYRVEGVVEVPGTASRRGGILDIYPPGAKLPSRIEMVGNQVESIRLFDPSTQLSVQHIERTFILPAQEVLPSLISQANLADQLRFLDYSNCTPRTGNRISEEIGMLVNGQAPEEAGFYSGIFCPGTPLDFFPQNGLLVIQRPSELDELGQTMDENAANLRDTKETRGDVPRNFPSSHIPWKQLRTRLSMVTKQMQISPWITGEDMIVNPSIKELGFLPGKSYGGHLEHLGKDIKDWQANGDRVLLVSQHASRLTEVLNMQGIQDIYVGDSKKLEYGLHKGNVALVHGSLEEGWTLAVDDSTTHVLTDEEIMGQRKQRRMRKNASQPHSAFTNALEPGGYLVHTEHGIGRFAGTRRIISGDEEKEYLEIEYAGNDKLYVPTDQLDRVSPYITPRDNAPVLTRLNTQEWIRSKTKAKASTFELAKELMALHASRETVQGISFSADTPWQLEMEDSFPHEETTDQLESIRDVKIDMEASKPMDRLICGDVGYGKTEVALRAAFKSVMDGFQVAMLVPTTILAQQHYMTFSQRLAPFPVQIEMLSRFRTHQDQLEVTKKLSSGSVDICIGTHRMLQKDVLFKNLGLLIIDEEQRFGVAHKERLKQMRKDSDILTLSATPIPRTLHMSLAGIRDMSTIQTPPEERLSIKTYVSEYSEDLIRDAIVRELDRGGQVFFLHNRVRTIERTAAAVRDIVPDAMVTVGHGKMNEDVLERVMTDFAHGKSDVLVCTTIIEAGLDITNVNTLIIDRADMFGLAQLYQLRGRVGRGANRAYAYLMIPRNHSIPKTAEKRLKTILGATELGAGFQIAMRDLEIRGAGNILGSEQSGHIHAIGYDLYSQLLAEAVEELKAGQGQSTMEAGTKLIEVIEVNIRLPISAYIPIEYIPDLTTRLGVYKRLAMPILHEDISSLMEEIRDRFGPFPKVVRDLFYILGIKALARDAGIESIAHNGMFVILQLTEPIGGVRSALQRALGESVTVGHSQIKLTSSDRWREGLLEVLESINNFKAYIMHLTSNGSLTEST